MASGFEGLDRILRGGFRYGGIHEFFGSCEQDTAAVSGLAAILASIAQVRSGSPCTWIISQHPAPAQLYPHGLTELAGAMSAGLIVTVPGPAGLLHAAHRALGQAGVVVLESRGDFARYDLTASRRLHLAAETSGAMLLLLRIAAQPAPSAALTRWAVRSAPSVALEANAPGHPAFDLSLLRQRGGPSGQSWRLAWDRDRHRFHEPTVPGVVVPASAGGATPAATGLRVAG